MIKAAWLNRQTSEVGEHLGEIALAKGDRNSALTDYELALATIAPHQTRIRMTQLKGMAISRAIAPGEGPVEKELTARVEALRKAGAKSAAVDGSIALQKMRTVALGAAQELNGTAEYRMLLSADKVERVEATGDKTLPGGDARLMKADFRGWVPPGSKAALVKVVLLNCHSGVCELVIEP